MNLITAYLLGFCFGAATPWLYHLHYRRRIERLLQRLTDATARSVELWEATERFESRPPPGKTDGR